MHPRVRGIKDISTMTNFQRVLPKHVNCIFQITDKSLLSEYRDFSLRQQTSLYPIALSVTFVFMLILFVGMAILSTDVCRLALSIFVCICTVSVVICGTFIGFLHYRIANMHKVSIEDNETNSSCHSLPPLTAFGGSNQSSGTPGAGISDGSQKTAVVEEDLEELTRIYREDISTVAVMDNPHGHQQPSSVSTNRIIGHTPTSSDPPAVSTLANKKSYPLPRNPPDNELVAATSTIQGQPPHSSLSVQVSSNGSSHGSSKGSDKSGSNGNNNSERQPTSARGSGRASSYLAKSSSGSSTTGNNEHPDTIQENLQENDPSNIPLEDTNSNDGENASIITSNYFDKLYRVSHYFVIAFQAFIITYSFRRQEGEICLGLDGDHDHDINPFQQLLNYFFCGNVVEGDIPIDVHLLLVIGPIITTVIFPSLDVKHVWLQMFSSIIVFIVISIEMEQIPSGLFLLFWLVTDIFVIGQIQLDKINRFYLHLKLLDLFAQNEKNAEAFHVNEMRYLIANMAHDLKTPLMSFTSAISMLEQFTQELEQACQGNNDNHNSMSSNNISYRNSNFNRSDSSLVTSNSSISIFAEIDTFPSGAAPMLSRQKCALTFDQVDLFVANVKECVGSLADTNAFMLMTINRSIDYAKAAKGIKLNPKFETIDVWEALQMPVNCMKNIQDRVSIELIPLPRDLLCKYIITDRQWLQENVLCLLSNAVKYSNKGKVTLTVNFYEKQVSLRRKLSKRKHSSSTSSSFNNEDPVAGSSTNNGGNGAASGQPPRQAWLMFSVEDNGIGVPPDAMLQLFKPFRQTQRLAGGTGLGLYSLAKRVDAIQGDYGVRKRRDGQRGSVFWFTIPYRPDESMLLLLNSNSTATTDQYQLNTASQMSLKEVLVSRGVASFDLNDSNSGHHTNSRGLPPRPSISSPYAPSSPHQMFSKAITSPPLRSSPSSSPLKHQQHSAFTFDDHHIAPIGIVDLESAGPYNLADEDSNVREVLDILLVDDAQTIVKMTSMMLRKLGHRITVAENGEEAVNIVENYWKTKGKCFDVILMDLQMPIMDGLEATKRIRAMEKSSRTGEGCDLPKQLILGVSANSDHETEEQAMQSGADAFIAKPFKANIFMDILVSLRRSKTNKKQSSWG